MPVDCLTAAVRLGQQMRRVWRGNALCGKVPANVQIRRIFSLLDCLMACACVARSFLLSADIIIQFFVARFKLASGPRNVFFQRRKFRFCHIQFFRGQSRRVRAAKPRLDQFRSLIGKPRSPRANIGGARLQICRSRVKSMQIGELFQEIAVGSLTFSNASFYGGQFALADLDVAFRLVAPLEKWFFFRLQLCNRPRLFARILLPFFFDLFDSFFDSCDSKCDFLLFLLQFLKRDDLVAQLRKIGRLGGALAPEIDLALPQETLLVTKRDARSLAPDFQSNLAKAGANETHGSMLAEDAL